MLDPHTVKKMPLNFELSFKTYLPQSAAQNCIIIDLNIGSSFFRPQVII